MSNPPPTPSSIRWWNFRTSARARAWCTSTATAAGAVTVTMSRPERRNAFNADLISAMAEAFETLRGAEGVRVVFLRGAGGTFSAGADLDWMRAAVDRTESDNREDAFDHGQMLKALLRPAGVDRGPGRGRRVRRRSGRWRRPATWPSPRGAKFSFSEVSWA